MKPDNHREPSSAKSAERHLRAWPGRVFSPLAAMVLGGLLGCIERTETSPPGATVFEGVTREPMILGDPAPDDDGRTRILIYHDMEGLSGQDDPRTYLFRYSERYAAGQEMLTADVNAVAAGLFDGGADEVNLVDAHGSGSSEPDILIDQLDARVERVVRDRPFRQYVDIVEPGVYDAIAVVGMHAKTGSRGFASHTYTLGMDWILNGMSITETEIVAYSWGRVDVPVIFASGDDRLESDLETMPWIEYVRVKDATSAGTAALRPLDEARVELRAGARRAVEGLSQARTMKLSEPIQAALRAVPPARLDQLDGVPGINYSDQTVTFEAPDFAAAYDGIVALIGVASSGFNDVRSEVLAASPYADEILFGAFEELFRRWTDVESGTWNAPESDLPSEARQYHGAN